MPVPLHSIENECSYGLLTKKLAGGNAEILSSWKTETMKGGKSERIYKKEKVKQHGWEYRSTQKRWKGKRNCHVKTEAIEKWGLEHTHSLNLLSGNYQNMAQC